MEYVKIWKDIKNYEGRYQVSTFGRIKSLNYKRTGVKQILNPSINGRGYFIVSFRKNGISKTFGIHQLVAIAFLGHIPNGHKLVINHKDFNKQNNYYKNLEITTNRNNTNRKHCKHSSQYTGVSWFNPSSKWRAIITISGKTKHLGLFKNEIDASNKYQKALQELI